MVNQYCKPTTTINQGEIIEPEIWQKQILKKNTPQTWREQLRECLEKKPHRLKNLYISVWMSSEDLEADMFFEKICTEVEQLKKYSTSAYEEAVKGIGCSFGKYFNTQDADIIPFSFAQSEGADHGNI